MTTSLFARFPMAVGHELHLELGRTRAIVLALLVTLCLAMVATIATRQGRPISAASARPAGDSPLRQPEFASQRGASASGARDVRPEIDALAASLAKRYRISVAATRGVVSAAYREGQRIGLDPLLIIAVIAVESRFNPIAESEMGAQGLMQVIPRFHKDHLDAAGVDSVLDPHSNIRVGAGVLKEYIKSGGNEVAGLQRYNGSSADATNAYAAKVLGEKVRLQQSVRQARAPVRA
ncbi:MAG: transglycosylase SLT domain-containing protein [Betaproteobacteria bacterium]